MQARHLLICSPITKANRGGTEFAGLDNLAAVASNTGMKPVIINGKGLKSIFLIYYILSVLTTVISLDGTHPATATVIMTYFSGEGVSTFITFRNSSIRSF